MRVLNSFSSTFRVGKPVIIHKEYKSGSVHLKVGEIGVIKKITLESLLYFGLIDIKVLYFKFGATDIAMAEKLAKEHIKPGKKL